jgi:hypothetical protein
MMSAPRILPQQMPSSTIHSSVRVPIMSDFSVMGDGSVANGDNKVFMSQTPIFTTPDSAYFQGSTVGTGTHPQNDIAGQTTTGNTTRPDFPGGQAPYQKLPNGLSVGALQAGEAPALWEMAPPPDPPVMASGGTGMLQPTAPAWW